MKRSEITRELGFIDPEFIAEAASYKPRRMNKIKVVALAACIAVIVTAIPLTLILNRESATANDQPAIIDNDNTVIDNTEPDKEEPLVIFCSSPTDLKQQLKANANVEIKDVAKRKEFSMSVYDTVVEKKSGTPYVKTVTIGNETFEISYNESRASETYQSLSTHLKAYASIDRYSTEHNVDAYCGQLLFEFSQETGELTEYFKSSTFYKSGDLGEKELHEIALQEIYNLYGIDISQNPNYNYECIIHPATSPYHPEYEYYQIIYCRYINGYETDEYIYVCLDTSGQIVSVKQNLGLYDEVAKTITAKKLEATKDDFLGSISNTSAVQENMYIELDNLGKCSIVFKVKDYVQIRTIYVEIG